jgi:hypothetical protein
MKSRNLSVAYAAIVLGSALVASCGGTEASAVTTDDVIGGKRVGADNRLAIGVLVTTRHTESGHEIERRECTGVLIGQGVVLTSGECPLMDLSSIVLAYAENDIHRSGFVLAPGTEAEHRYSVKQFVTVWTGNEALLGRPRPRLAIAVLDELVPSSVARPAKPFESAEFEADEAASPAQALGSIDENFLKDRQLDVFGYGCKSPLPEQRPAFATKPTPYQLSSGQFTFQFDYYDVIRGRNLVCNDLDRGGPVFFGDTLVGILVDPIVGQDLELLGPSLARGQMRRELAYSYKLARETSASSSGR